MSSVFESTAVISGATNVGRLDPRYSSLGFISTLPFDGVADVDSRPISKFGGSWPMG